jgi:hypothetical protein
VLCLPAKPFTQRARWLGSTEYAACLHSLSEDPVVSSQHSVEISTFSVCWAACCVCAKVFMLEQRIAFALQHHQPGCPSQLCAAELDCQCCAQQQFYANSWNGGPQQFAQGHSLHAYVRGTHACTYAGLKDSSCREDPKMCPSTML